MKKSRQTYKLGVWIASKREPRRDVLYSPHTKRIFVPRLGERSALDVAVDLAKEIAWSGDFEPVADGWA